MRLDIIAPTTNAKIRSLGFTSSRYGIAYNIVFCIFLAVTNCACILFTYISDFGSKVKYEKEIDCLEYSVTAFTALLLLATFCVKRNETIAIANQISSINEALPISSNGQNSISMYIVKVFLADLVLWIMLNFTTSLFESIDFVVYNLSYSSNYVLNAMMLQYSIALKLIQHLFRSINENLRNFARQSVCVNFLTDEGNSKITVQKLIGLHKLYASLVEVSHNVSRFYSLPMFFCILSTFISTTLACYYLAKPIVLGESHKLTITTSMHCFLYGFIYVFLLVTLARSVTATINEVTDENDNYIYAWLLKRREMLVCYSSFLFLLDHIYRANELKRLSMHA